MKTIKDGYKLLDKVNNQQHMYIKNTNLCHTYLTLNAYTKIKPLLSKSQRKHIISLLDAVNDVDTQVDKLAKISVNSHRRHNNTVNSQVKYYTVKIINNEKRIIPHYKGKTSNSISPELSRARYLSHKLNNFITSLGNNYVCTGEYPNTHVITIKEAKNLIKNNK